MGKPHLSFLMTVGPHFAVTLGLDISVIGFKGSLLMRNTKGLILKRSHPLLQSPTLCISLYNSHTHSHRCSRLSSCVVDLTAGIKNHTF